VGERTEEQLLRLGLRTVADLAATAEPTLRRALGEGLGRSLAALAWGRDPRPVVAAAAPSERSTGAQETFARDVDDPVVVRRELLRLSARTAARLRSTHSLGRTVVLTVRFSDFTTITRSRTLREATDVTQDIYATATALWEALGLQRARIRLVGVRVEGLVDAAHEPRQLRLDEREAGWPEADRAVDRAAARFGAGAVRPAVLVDGRQLRNRVPTRLSTGSAGTYPDVHTRP